ncbi:MAG: tol-pal system protein YbgF [Henriciella sp.]|nr:tol-pal system protein YbgF [Henriciella sp.]
MMRQVLIAACFLGMIASVPQAHAQASVRQGSTSGQLAAEVNALRAANASMGARITGLESDKASLAGEVETLGFLLSQSRDEINRMQEDDAEIGRLIARLEDRIDAQDDLIADLQDQIAESSVRPGFAEDARLPAGSPQQIIDQVAGGATSVGNGRGSAINEVDAAATQGGPTRIVRRVESPGDAAGAQSTDAEFTTDGLPQGTLGTISATALPGEAGPLFAEAKSRLLQFDYAGAEAAFGAFLNQFGDDPQAGEAQYWLGEVLYQQEEYAASGQAYTKMIREYPDDARAPEALAKLARSMRLVGDTERACNALDLLPQQYPNASGVTRNLAAGERLRSGCDS